jgi:hypothetical protein
MTEIWDPAIADDLRAFVQFVFPWGKEGTPLHKFKEPRTWQLELLEEITDHIKVNKARMAEYEVQKKLLPRNLSPIDQEKRLEQWQPKKFQAATVSGRGIGKSSVVSWLDLWMMSTRLGSSTIVTANTEDQLKMKTWAELGKWHTLLINAHWFERSALSVKPNPWFEELLKSQLKIDTGLYYGKAQLWSEENPDAFAGSHNMAGMLLIMDEASGIPPAIWKVSEGFFTEPVLDRYWLVFSNGRRNTGTFFECFHKDREFWSRRKIDGRTVEGTDKAVYEEIIKKHGEDSDPARIEVKGDFPRQSDNQFISREVVDAATRRTVEEDHHAPLIMGVDVARFGNDSSVIRFRQGRDARSIPPIKVRGLDNMALANLCAKWISKMNPDAVCIDAGNGTGVIDRLREMKYKVHEVWFGAGSPEPEYANFRTHIWALMREWLGGGCIDGDQDLKDDLVSPQYKFQGNSDKTRLETKEELKARGFSSPDHGDALACTFAVKVARRDLKAARGSIHSHPKGRPARNTHYDLFGR